MSFKKIKNFILIFFIQLITIILVTFTAFAKNIVNNMTINVIVNDDGSANITQIWESNPNEGTEFYLPINTDDFTISNFNVSMDGKNFEILNQWKIDATFDEKAYKCGINKIDEGVELCFGISEYGKKHNYKFSYDVSSLVKSYNDYDGFYFMFVNPSMSTFPTNLKWDLKVRNGKTLSSNNARIWGFGFDGKVDFNNGRGIANSKVSLNNDNNCVIMMSFNKGIINPIVKQNYDFEKIKDLAFKGSDYETTIKN